MEVDDEEDDVAEDLIPAGAAAIPDGVRNDSSYAKMISDILLEIHEGTSLFIKHSLCF